MHAAAIPGQTETESEPHLILLLALLFGRVFGGYNFIQSRLAKMIELGVVFARSNIGVMISA